MKKLNITKEQFNRSRYFQRKYGKLEYVSESGKLFKTNKGKVLMFNEGFKDKIKGFGRTLGNFMEMFTKGTNVYVWHSDTGDWYDALDNNEPVWCGKIVERKASSGEYGIEISKLKSKDAKHRKLKTGDSVNIYDVAGAYQSGTVSKIDGNMLYVARSVPSDNDAEEIDNDDKELFDTTESTKKFGKKFNESGEFEKQRREFNRKRKGISEDLNEFYDRINSIYEQLTNLTDEYSPYEEDDPDMANYFDLLHDAERKILRVSSDITDRIDHL